MRRTAAVLTTLICSAGVLTGCGEDEPTSGTTGPETIEITFSGGSVEPNGERIEVERGQEITLVVKSDEAGELHVHTEPEKELAYDVGTTELKLTIDEPGVVDVEDHHLEVVVVQLEVS